MRLIRSLITALGLSASLTSQCVPSVLPGDGLPGTSGLVNATIAWDPDGAGPELEALVVAGQFISAGNLATTHVALWKPGTASWEPLGSGIAPDALVKYKVSVNAPNPWWDPSIHGIGTVGDAARLELLHVVGALLDQNLPLALRSVQGAHAKLRALLL